MSDNVKVRVAVAGVRALEVLENLVRSVLPRPESPTTQPARFWYEDDGNFWEATRSGDITHGTVVEFAQVALSEWRARVPGLYWTPAAQRLREIGDPALGGEEIVAGIAAMRPLGKSARVLQGGVGTLPPEAYEAREDRTCTLTTTCNASAGVPARIPAALWQRRGHELIEGVMLRGRGVWRSLSEDWSGLLPQARQLKRGVLEVTELTSLQARSRVWIHPFNVMSYVEDEALFYDFVYAERRGDADARERERVDRFFTEYAARAGRAGRYLLGRGGGPSEETTLDVDGERRNIRARVEGLLGEDPTIQALVVAITQACEGHPGRLKLLGHDAGVTPTLWVRDHAKLADQVHDLLEAARRQSRVPELVAVLAADCPEIWTEAHDRAGRRT